MAVFKSWVTTDGFQKVWEHKGISKEIKQVLYAENQRIRTFTRSPAWGYVARSDEMGNSRASRSGASDRVAPRFLYSNVNQKTYLYSGW